MSDRDIRQQIVDAATRLFAERGFGSTSVRELVEAAGVTKPTLYYHFGSKEDLFHELVRLHLARVTARFDDLLGAPGTVRERLTRFVEGVLAGADEKPHATQFLLLLRPPSVRGDHPPVDTVSVHRAHLEMVAQLVAQGQQSGELRAGMDPMECSLALLGMVNLQLLARVHGKPVGGTEAAAMIDIFFDGVGVS